MSDIKSQVTIDAFRQIDTGKAMSAIIGLSVAAFVFLIWLVYFREGAEHPPAFANYLPTINATFNSISTILLLFGFKAIKDRKFVLHMRFMVGAFVSSTLFLVGYVIYHTYVGHTPFPGEGFIRPVYFFILITHIVLSALVVPLILSSFYFAFSGRFTTHRKLSKITLPVWLYVSITGVIIYFFLRAYI